jgi:hypothetical protein
MRMIEFQKPLTNLAILSILVGCWFYFGATSDAALDCPQNCDSGYSQCYANCVNLPPNQQVACAQGCAGTYQQCSSGCFDPNCTTGCGAQLNTCFGVCTADLNVCNAECLVECNGDTQSQCYQSCSQVCLSVRNSCGSFCNAAHFECLFACTGQ